MTNSCGFSVSKPTTAGAGATGSTAGLTAWGTADSVKLAGDDVPGRETGKSSSDGDAGRLAALLSPMKSDSGTSAGAGSLPGLPVRTRRERLITPEV